MIRACTFIFFINFDDCANLLTFFVKNTILKKYKMCTVIEKLIIFWNSIEKYHIWFEDHKKKTSSTSAFLK